MNKALLEALDALEKEKQIPREVLFDAIENSLLTACKNHFGKADNMKVELDRETCDYFLYAEKEVVEEVTDEVTQIGLEAARQISADADLGDIVKVEIKSQEFGRIAAQNARNVITQKIREEERSVVYNIYYAASHFLFASVFKIRAAKIHIKNCVSGEAYAASFRVQTNAPTSVPRSMIYH